MGGAVSSGRDNNELVDNLMGGGYIRTRAVERVFRVLDRADYMIPSERDQAYKDLAWRNGALHLSAPCIYSEVLEALELKPGLSFLNLGSGTGYLSALVGLIIGTGGISHGVEIHPGVIEYSNKKLSQFQDNSVTLDEFDFCVPKYYCGNALCLAPLQTQYDRVYVGAGVLSKYENYFKQMIKVGGVLVMPLGETLVQIHRVSETEWTTRRLLNVSFALLRAPTNEEAVEPLKLDELVPVSLMLLCRATIRSAMRGGVCRRQPELKEPPPYQPAAAARPPSRRICIPLDANSQDPALHELHDLREQEGGREMNALLSLVLSMGNNRVAGSLRFGDDLAREPNHELEVLIDDLSNQADSSESDDSGGSPPTRPRMPAPRSPSPPPRPPSAEIKRPVFPGSDMRPSDSGAANASTIQPDEVPSVFSGSAGRLGGLRCDARGVTRTRAEPAPGATASGTDLTALNPAGRVEVDDFEVVLLARPTLAPYMPVRGHSTSPDESKPSTSGESPPSRPAPDCSAPGEPGGSKGSESGKDPAMGSAKGPSKDRSKDPGSSSSTSAGAEEDGPGAPRLRRHIHLPSSQRGRGMRPKRCMRRRAGPRSRVQIFFGNAGCYDGDDVVAQEEEGTPAPAPASTPTPVEDDSMDGESSSSDDQRAASCQDKKRLKLGSGSGKCAVFSSGGEHSGTSSFATTDASADVSASESNSASANYEGVWSRRRGGGAAGGEAGGEESTEELRRRSGRGDARRVRLSLAMKRAIKELPLPYSLKKFVNLYRCFEI